MRLQHQLPGLDLLLLQGLQAHALCVLPHAPSALRLLALLDDWHLPGTATRLRHHAALGCRRLALHRLGVKHRNIVTLLNRRRSCILALLRRGGCRRAVWTSLDLLWSAIRQGLLPCREQPADLVEVHAHRGGDDVPLQPRTRADRRPSAAATTTRTTAGRRRVVQHPRWPRHVLRVVIAHVTLRRHDVGRAVLLEFDLESGRQVPLLRDSVLPPLLVLPGLELLLQLFLQGRLVVEDAAAFVRRLHCAERI
mmetsp:Transcript_47957/g.138062  ORF Transcript_47957/g.138062 Transcript_47957/m.138062 type:complete len:252 (-) Transcript_47957:3575-4330(-)